MTARFTYVSYASLTVSIIEHLSVQGYVPNTCQTFPKLGKTRSLIDHLINDQGNINLKEVKNGFYVCV